METLADRIRIRLAELNQTPADLIRARVLSKAGVYNVLNGTTSPAKIQSATLDKFARALRVNREWLTSGKGPKDQGVAEDSARYGSPEASESQAEQASQSVRLDGDKLMRSIQFLERQFGAWGRDFVASEHADLIAGVYARIGKRGESNLVALSQWLTARVTSEDEGNVGTGGVRRAG